MKNFHDLLNQLIRLVSALKLIQAQISEPAPRKNHLPQGILWVAWFSESPRRHCKKLHL